MNNSLILKTALLAALATPMLASAESDITVGTGSASARLNFRITVPGFVALKIGSGTILTDGGSVDTVDFPLTDAQAMADGAVTASSGAVAVALMSNVGNVNFGSTGADLSNGSGDTIPLSQISVATTTGSLAHPTFNAAATSVAPTAGRIINRSGTWTFSYAHQGATAPVGSGTYQTTVTYTAAMP